MSRYSYKREAILNCVRGTKTHPSADWVFSQLKPVIPDLSLGTVYRNLNLFKQQGLVASVGVVNGLERFDSETQPHVHFICDECGAVIDLKEITIPEEAFQKAGSGIGARVTGCEINLHGVCPACAEREAKNQATQS